MSIQVVKSQQAMNLARYLRNLPRDSAVCNLPSRIVAILAFGVSGDGGERFLYCALGVVVGERKTDRVCVD